MPGIRETRSVPYSAEQMFDLVADVARYPEFLPWVVATRVKSDSDTEMVADMLVGFKALREKFTSRVIKDRPNRIEVIYVDGPMKDLDNIWRFIPRADGGPRDLWRLGALNAATTLTGSALLALAVAAGRLTLDEAWAAAHVDEDWNKAFWGRDTLALERRAFRLAEMQAAASVLAALR